jgi:hypothetical protein
VLLTIVSGVLWLLLAEQLFPQLYCHGIYYTLCSEKAWTPQLELIYYLNYLIKWWELVDTGFLVIKKKKLGKCLCVCVKKVGITFKKVGITFKKVGITFEKVGITIKKVGITLKKVGITFKKVGITFRKVGIIFKMVGITFRKVGIIFKKVGITFEKVGITFMSVSGYTN